MKDYYQPRKSLPKRAFGFLFSLVLLVGGSWLIFYFSDALKDAGSNAIASIESLSETLSTPTPSSSPTPLATPPAAPGTGSYAFEQMVVETGTPVAYDPCRPIEYVVNRATQPPGADLLLDQALAEVSKATGLQFSYQGESSEIPSLEREVYNSSLYGERWAPVLIAWSDEQITPGLSGDVLGLAGSSALSTSGAAAYVSGVVQLDGPDLALMLSEEDAAKEVQATIMHELAHLVGLGHVDDPLELMNPILIPEVTSFGSGDLTGLAVLGAGECFSELDKPGDFNFNYLQAPLHSH